MDKQNYRRSGSGRKGSNMSPPSATHLLDLPEKPAKKQPERIGAILRRVREHRGEDIDAISEYLHIRAAFLLALEESRYDDLPADAYVIGFLRSYTAYLGLDGKGAIDMYRREMAGRRRKPTLVMPKIDSGGRAPTAALLIGAALFALALYAAWYAFVSGDRAKLEIDIPAPTPTVQEEPAVGPDQPAPSVLPVPMSKPALPESGKEETSAPKGGITLRIEKESWILITDKSGNTIFDKILKPGETYAVPEGEALSLTTSDGSGLIINIDGKDIPRLSETTSILRRISLDREHLNIFSPPDH